MSAQAKACLPDDTVSEALATMKHFRVRRLPVIDSHGILEGIISMNDIARAADASRSVSPRELISDALRYLRASNRCRKREHDGCPWSESRRNVITITDTLSIDAGEIDERFVRGGRGSRSEPQ